MMGATTARAGLLFDYAVAHPDGFTVDDVKSEFGWSADQTNRAARALRMILAEDTINLVCDPSGQRTRWRYRLVGNLEDAKPWASNRLRDIENRLETICGVAKSIAAATDGRSTEGRRARKIYKTLDYLHGELADIDGRLL